MLLYTLNQFLLDGLAVLLEQPSLMLEDSLYIGVLARLIYVMCYLTFWRSLGTSKEERKGEKWGRFAAKEVALLTISIVFSLAGIFILTMSILAGGRMLVLAARNNAARKKGLKVRIQQFFGLFLNPLVALVAIVWLSIRYFNEGELGPELISLIMGTVFWLVKQLRLSPIATIPPTLFRPVEAPHSSRQKTGHAIKPR